MKFCCEACTCLTVKVTLMCQRTQNNVRACLLSRIEELQTQLDAAHQARARQKGLTDSAAVGELQDDASQSLAVELRAQLALLQRQLKASQVLPPLASCMWDYLRLLRTRP